ncbi:MAG: amidohydrolase family protein [Bacillota bacterium]|jgi:imidazolonepropionase-like amidohydrolase|nr:amidohydrolase family protein [Bacillota bacterium]NLL26488.1 amidohydrolase family protein [Erysipelotrichia bacterium]
MKTVYKNVNILDGTKDMVLKENMMLTVEDGIIVSIEEVKNIKENNVIDLQGKYLIPGLINLHIHTPGTGFPKKKETDSTKLAKLVMSNKLLQQIGKSICRNALKTEVLSGTTTVRTVGGLGNFDSQLRDEINSGKTVGPRVFSCDSAVTIPGGHMEGSVAYGAKTIEEFEEFIENNAKANVDWIKLMITGGVLDAKVKGEPGELRMNAQQVKACCDKAHSLGLKVCAHVESPQGIVMALENGVDTIEHGAAMNDDTIELFKKTGAILVCTISPAIPLAKFDPVVSKASEIVLYNSEVLLEGILSGTKKCLENGITVGLGTDTVCPFITHYDMWRELEYFHKLVGVSRNFALHTGTLINASILGIENETGSIEVGKSADFVVTDENPLTYGFSTIRKPYLVHFKNQQFLQPKIKKNKICEKELDNYLATL